MSSTRKASSDTQLAGLNQPVAKSAKKIVKTKYDTKPAKENYTRIHSFYFNSQGQTVWRPRDQHALVIDPDRAEELTDGLNHAIYWAKRRRSEGLG